ncbi:MAG: alpha-xylosidase, partial [Treponema sp.]|nr:alpha-xylosidase [Treponema sp.]
MKFTNGYWLIREGIEAHFAATAFDAVQNGNELDVFAPDKPKKTRGDTLNECELTVRYSSPMENIIRVRITHFEGAADGGVHFDLHEADPFGSLPFTPVVSLPNGTDGELPEAALRAGGLSVRIPLGGSWDVSFCAEGRVLTKCEAKSTGYMVSKRGGGYREDPFLEVPQGDKTPPAGTYIKEELTLGVGEWVYGFGERFG